MCSSLKVIYVKMTSSKFIKEEVAFQTMRKGLSKSIPYGIPCKMVTTFVNPSRD
jgi:hypothetical protein